jgi:type I restriction enzyme R subunit
LPTDYFEADTAKKLSLILQAEEHILGLDDGKKRYINEVSALSQASPLPFRMSRPWM